jgi:hypothetical protein
VLPLDAHASAGYDREMTTKEMSAALALVAQSGVKASDLRDRWARLFAALR